MAAPALEPSKDFPAPRGKIMVRVNGHERESVLNLAQHALHSLIPLDAGPAIVVISNSRIFGTSLPVESSDFTEQLKRLQTVAVDADPIITKLEGRVAAAALMFHKRNLPLLIVCPPFETGNKGLDPPMVDVLAGSEELELTWSQANNFEFTVMDIRKSISPKPLMVEVPSLVTLLGHYPLPGSNGSHDDIIFDSTARGHIFSKKELLKDFKEYATPKMVTLPDGTNVPILGSGKIKTVAFDIPDVEFVPDLKVNVVSMNQLGRDHDLFCDFRGKTLEIIKDDQTVVGAGVRKNNGIYVLQNLHVPEPQM